MDSAMVAETIVKILVQIQRDSDLECPSLTGATRPVDEIPKFDSKVWPVATTLLAMNIGAAIPNDVNIFVDETSKRPRSIAEIAGFVCELVRAQAIAAGTVA